MEDPESSQKTNENSLNMTSKENKGEFSSSARVKESISSENFEKGSKLISKNFKQN